MTQDDDDKINNLCNDDDNCERNAKSIKKVIIHGDYEGDGDDDAENDDFDDKGGDDNYDDDDNDDDERILKLASESMMDTKLYQKAFQVKDWQARNEP